MKYSSKFYSRTKEFYRKNKFFHLLNALLVGLTKLEDFQWCKVTKLKPLQTVTSFCQVYQRTYLFLGASYASAFFKPWDDKIPAIASVP
jgi:hypothetical protein